jgi:sucrose-6-phosphate hydrolase SacC (GH32 family)
MAAIAGFAQMGSLLCLGADDLPIGHLKASSYGDWVATGTAFNPGPVSGETLAPLEIENASNDFVISSEREGDGPVGTLTSPEFKISRNYIAFRIGGGDYERDTCLDLLIDGKVVKRATGWRSDRLVANSWDVRPLHGRKAKIQIVDRASGDWGHINVARIAQTDHPERAPNATAPLYQEALRPQFHFTARQWMMNRLNPGMQQEGWVNDLNGLIYYDGEYDMFAQRWAKCWIHAVSRDLVHWTELEPAFWEEKAGSGSQSGTCVIDYNNTSGLAANKSNPAMVAFFPRWNNREQCIAYSLDHGRTWKYYEKNPVLTHAERDPKVFWYAPGNHWVMMLYGDQQYHILTSSNLLSWKDEHHPIKDSYECPDFFELPIDGDRKQMKWVLIQGNGNYSIGTFDGTEFKEETERHPCDVGPNFYATQSWHNTDTGDGRRIQTAWMRGSNFPDMPFSQQISFPCELTLRNTPKGLRVYRKPIAEITSLHQTPDTWMNRTLQANHELALEPSGRLFHIKATLDIAEGAKAIFNLRGNQVVLTAKTVQSGNPAVEVFDKVQTVEMLVDVGSIETFVNDGEISSTRFALPRENKISVKAEGGAVQLKSLEVYPLESAWRTSK